MKEPKPYLTPDHLELMGFKKCSDEEYRRRIDAYYRSAEFKKTWPKPDK